MHYLIAKEYHEDGSPHFHLLLTASTKFDFNLELVHLPSTSNHEDLYKPHYTSVTNYNAIMTYLFKFNEHIDNLPDHVKYSKNDKYSTTDNMLHVSQRLVKESVDKILRDLIKEDPKIINRIIQVRNNLLKAQELLKPTEEQPLLPYTMKDFKKLPVLDNWLKNLSSGHGHNTLIIVGPSGVGKTVLVPVLAQESNWKLCFINEKQGFKKLEQEEYDGFVLDDFDFDRFNLKLTAFLALVENDKDVDIRVLYGSVCKKKHVIQIITCNYESFLQFKDLLKVKQVCRRTSIVKVPNDLIINFNVTNVTNNILINQHTHIYNNQENIDSNIKAIKEIEDEYGQRKVNQ